MKTLSLLLSLTALSAPAAAQDVVGLGWAGDVYDIDLATGNSSYVGNCGFSRINAMAKAPDGTLYAVSDSDLITIDPVTGLASYVATTNLNSVRGLAFDGSGTLYAAENPVPTAIDEDILYTIDVGTGATTLVGATGYFGIQGLSFANGVLYAFEIGNGSGLGDGLITIDPVTAVATDVNPSIGGSGSEGQCLFSDTSGNLYCANAELFSVDTSTGLVTLIGGGAFSVRGAEVLGAGPSISVTDLVAGQTATLSVSSAESFGVVFPAYSLQGAGPTSIATTIGTFDFELTPPIRRIPPLFCDVNGAAATSIPVPPAASGVSVWVHALALDATGATGQLTNALALTVQ